MVDGEPSTLKCKTPKNKSSGHNNTNACIQKMLGHNITKHG